MFLQRCIEVASYNFLIPGEAGWLIKWNFAHQIFIYLGTYAYQPNWLNRAFSGAPLGEMVQWSDLLASLYVLGHDITISDNATTYMRYVIFLFNSSPMGELGKGAYESGWWCQAKWKLRAGRAGIRGHPESGSHHQAASRWETQRRYLPTSIVTKTNKEGGKWEGQTAAQKQDLALERTARPSRLSTRHLKLGENSYVK